MCFLYVSFHLLRNFQILVVEIRKPAHDAVSPDAIVLRRVLRRRKSVSWRNGIWIEPLFFVSQN